MFDSSPQSWLLVIVVGAFTAAAAFWDWRHWRIPNKLTLPTFALGWVYQAVFNGWSGLGDAALGFLCGFGVLFILWMVGGGGGGDVKLMGALSVWLGYRHTLMVLIVSTLMVIVGTGAIMLWSVLTQGFKKTQDRYLATGKTEKGEPVRKETVKDRQTRRVMGYAVPVAVATWLVMLFNLSTLP
ncbi:MAG: A24 family peptidase [Planctomycetaceae bacterium]